jgi:hypothetical protein
MESENTGVGIGLATSREAMCGHGASLGIWWFGFVGPLSCGFREVSEYACLADPVMVFWVRAILRFNSHVYTAKTQKIGHLRPGIDYLSSDWLNSSTY